MALPSPIDTDNECETSAVAGLYPGDRSVQEHRVGRRHLDPTSSLEEHRLVGLVGQGPLRGLGALDTDGEPVRQPGCCYDRPAVAACSHHRGGDLFGLHDGEQPHGVGKDTNTVASKLIGKELLFAGGQSGDRYLIGGVVRIAFGQRDSVCGEEDPDRVLVRSPGDIGAVVGNGVERWLS